MFHLFLSILNIYSITKIEEILVKEIMTISKLLRQRQMFLSPSAIMMAKSWGNQSSHRGITTMSNASTTKLIHDYNKTASCPRTLSCNSFLQFNVEMPLTNMYFSTSSTTPSTTSKKRKKIIPKRAPVKLTPKARKFFKDLIDLKAKSKENDNSIKTENLIAGIILKYQQSNTGQPRMVFTFDYVAQNELSDRDEPVSLEIIGTKQPSDTESDESVSDASGDMIMIEIPKSPQESYDDGLPKLYIHQHAFMKVLGCTIDIDTKNFSPILFDKEGNQLDPNA
jgi:hypothetical protein